MEKMNFLLYISHFPLNFWPSLVLSIFPSTVEVLLDIIERVCLTIFNFANANTYTIYTRTCMYVAESGVPAVYSYE